LKHKIVGRRRTATAARDHVVDVEGRAVTELGESAVLTSPSVPLEHQVPQRSRDRRATHAAFTPCAAMARIWTICAT
jgi:hypothetical protein